MADRIADVRCRVTVDGEIARRGTHRILLSPDTCVGRRTRPLVVPVLAAGAGARGGKIILVSQSSRSIRPVATGGEQGVSFGQGLPAGAGKTCPFFV